MKDIIKILASASLAAGMIRRTGGKKYDPARTLANPIDLDYAFAEGGVTPGKEVIVSGQNPDLQQLIKFQVLP